MNSKITVIFFLSILLFSCNFHEYDIQFSGAYISHDPILLSSYGTHVLLQSPDSTHRLISVYSDTIDLNDYEDEKVIIYGYYQNSYGSENFIVEPLVKINRVFYE